MMRISAPCPVTAPVGRKNLIRGTFLLVGWNGTLPLRRQEREGWVIRWMTWAIVAFLKPKALLVAENLCLRRPPASASTAAVAAYRSAILDPGKAMVFRLARRAAHCPARDGLAMAPRRVEDLLALALKTPAKSRTPPDFGGASDADPADGFREPLLGSAKDPSR